MAHLVESMMYVGKTPWHGLGKEMPEGTKLGIDEALIAAGLDWEVELRHLFTDDQNNEKLGILDQYAVCRQSDDSILGIVGPDYVPLQNRDAFKWFQPFLDSGNAAQVDHGATLSLCWLPNHPGVRGHLSMRSVNAT